MICEQKQSFSRGRKSLSSDSHHPIGEGLCASCPLPPPPQEQDKRVQTLQQRKCKVDIRDVSCLLGLERVQRAGGFGGAVEQADFGTMGCCLSHDRLRTDLSAVPSRELQLREIHGGLQLPWEDVWVGLSRG